MYEYNSQLYQENDEYLEKSMLMQLNPNEIPTVMLNYQFRKRPEQMKNFLISLRCMRNALLDEDTCTAIIRGIWRRICEYVSQGIDISYRHRECTE